MVNSDISNELLQNYHRKMLEKSEQSLQSVAVSLKLNATETFSFDDKNIKAAKMIIERAIGQLLHLSQSTPKNSVYHLNINLFPLLMKN